MMSIEYLDKTHARLVVSKGSGANRIRRVKRITYTSKRDARKQYEEFERSVRFTRDSKMTIGEMLDLYIDAFKTAQGKQTTAAGYISASKAIKPVIGKIRASEATLTDIDSFIRKQSKKYSPKTVKNQLSLINSAYKHSIRHGLLSSNPCQYATLPRQKKPKIKSLSDTDFKKFVTALDTVEPDFRVMCELALFCGLRRSEILGLKHSDVSEIVTISKVRHRINGQDIVETPKTAMSNRTLAVPAFLQEHVKALVEQQKTRPAESDYLIQNALGEPVSQSWVRSRMDALIKNNELPRVTMHGLRHTYASMLINQGVPIAEVSSELGHSSIDITLRTYTHLFADASTASKRISALMDNLMAPNGHQFE